LSTAPVSSAVCYKDPKKALRWLEEAFGFAPSEWDKAMSVKTKARL
jgi:hypothetical protein